nr:transposase [Paenibacillus lentus]
MIFDLQDFIPVDHVSRVIDEMIEAIPDEQGTKQTIQKGHQACTTAKGNRQVHWNTIWEELKAKAKAALECEEKSAIYTRRKVEVESVFGNIKGNRSFRRFSLRGLDKVYVEFGIVALAHNLLKVAGFVSLLSSKVVSQKKLERKH